MAAEEIEYAYKAANVRKTRVLHAMGHPRLGPHISPCGKALGGAVKKEDRRLYDRCEQCFIQVVARTIYPKPTAPTIENRRPPRAEWPGTLIQNARHVRRQLEKLAVKFPDLATWAGQQSRYLKIGLDEIGAGD